MAVAAALQHQLAARRDLQLLVGVVARLQAVFKVEIKQAQQKQAGGQRHSPSKATVGVVSGFGFF